MRRSETTHRFRPGAALAAALFALAAHGATPAKKPAAAQKPAPAAAKPAAAKPAAHRPYHLELEADPAAPFPFLGKFGKIALHVYPGGVRADALGMSAFSRNGDKQITAQNSLTHLYTEVPIGEISGVLGKLGGLSNDKIYAAIANLESPVAGKVSGIDATRYRLTYSPGVWIDVWTTSAVPENPQVKRIVTELVYSLSPGTGAMSRMIPGNPVYVELNFPHFKKLPLVRLKSLTFDNKGEPEALAVGSTYAKVPLVDSVWGGSK